jgi:uncharacterized protein
MGIAGGLAVRFGRAPETVPAASGPAAECVVCDSTGVHGHSLLEKVRAMGRYAFGTFLDDIAVQLVIGILIAALISFLIPDGLLVKYISNDLIGMALMVVIGIPMYVCATASIPIAVALMEKGLSPGAAFVFLCVGPATNAATILLVTRAMGKRFMGVYLGTMVVGSVLAGLGLNGLFGVTGMGPEFGPHAHHHGAEAAPWWMTASVYLFAAILALSLIRTMRPGLLRRLRRWSSRAVGGGSGVVLHVDGMTCSHCASHVREALESVKGVTKVTVDLGARSAAVEGDADESLLRDAVNRAGYKPV